MSLQRFGINPSPQSLEELLLAFSQLARVVEAFTKCPDLVVGADGVRIRPQLAGFAGQPSAELVLARDQFLISGVTYSEGDGYACRVRWGYLVMRDAAGGIDSDALQVIMPLVGGLPMNDPEVGTLAFTEGDSIFLKIETDAKDLLKFGTEVPTPLPMATIVAAPSDQKSTHYQPIDPVDTYGVDGVYYYKIANLTIDSEDASRVMVEQVQGDGPIFHTPNLWEGRNLGGGAKGFLRRNKTEDAYEFRTHKGNYGMGTYDPGDEVLYNQINENVGSGEPVWIEPKNGAGDPLPPKDYPEGPSQLRTIRGLYSGEDGLITKQINVEISDGEGADPGAADTIRVRGNSKMAALIFKDCAGAEVARLSWEDGLITEDANIEVTLGECTETPAP